MIIRPGSILLFSVEKLSASTLLTSGIRLVTGNQAVHVGTVLLIGAAGEIQWVDTNPFQAMRFHKTTIQELRKGYGDLKFQGIASLPFDWLETLPLEKEFLRAARGLYMLPAAKHYSYRTIASQLIDHGYRKFKATSTPYKVWIKPNGYICSVLAAKIIDQAISKYYPDWAEKAPLETFEPDDFTVAPFQVEYAL